MFNFFKPVIQAGEIWVYQPDFPDSDRGATVEILEVGKDAVKIKSIAGKRFKEYQDKKGFLTVFKKFK